MGRTDLSSRNKKTRRSALVQRWSIISVDRSASYIQLHIYTSSHFPAKPLYLEFLNSTDPSNNEAHWHENGVLTIIRRFLDDFGSVREIDVTIGTCKMPGSESDVAPLSLSQICKFRFSMEIPIFPPSFFVNRWEISCIFCLIKIFCPQSARKQF